MNKKGQGYRMDYVDFPGSSSGKESAYKVQEILVRFLGQEDLLEKG